MYVTGLPSGAAAGILVSGPSGFAQSISGTSTITGLAPGTYTLTAAPVLDHDDTWSPGTTSQSITVIAGAEAGASVSYAVITGRLTVSISGLAVGTGANITISGPGGFSRHPQVSQDYTGLLPGNYTVQATAVSASGSSWQPAPLTQSVVVAASTTPASASVSYSSSGSGGGTLNLRIDGLYVTQAAQRYDGSVPLVANRDGYLRVFVLANQVNTAQPRVRVRLYSSGALVQTYTINAPGAGVPLGVDEGSLTMSWNVLVPAALMQPNLAVLAEVDPTGAIAEINEGDNTFPSGGVPGEVSVRALPPFNVRFVPVLQSVNSLQGSVTATSVPSFLSTLLTLLPVGDYDADVRAPYTTSAPALVSDNANGAWGTILSEVLALKSTDASMRYYYGVVKTSYSSGIAGMGYVGGGARTAIGWDRLPSGSGVMAHEVGHNMGRSHVPCGGAGGADPGYPHGGGSIGIWGLDVATLQLKNPSTYYDLMGYCDPDWVSDHSWSAMVAFREGGPYNAAGLSDRLTVGRGLLVWGRITPSGLVLEPAFAIDHADLSPPAAGPHRIEGRDPNGAVMFSIPFAAHESHDLPTGPEEAFAFVVPAGRALSADLAELTLRSGGRSVVRRPAPATVPAPVFTRGADGRGHLRWNAALHPVVMVRDAVTGQVLSFARGGSVRLPASVTRLDATFSDGTRSSRRILTRR